MSRIAIITNPYTKANLHKPELLAQIKKLLRPQDILIHTRSILELKTALCELKYAGYRDFAIHGGDGSISCCLTQLRHVFAGIKFPHIATLGGGSMNVVKKHLGIKANCLEIIRHLQQEDYTIKRQNSLLVEDRLGFIYADTLVSHFLETYYKKAKTIPAAALLIAKLALSQVFKGKLFSSICKDEQLSLQVDSHEKITTVSCANFCSTVSHLPGRVRFFTDAILTSDVFELRSIIAPATHLAHRVIPRALLLANKRHKEDSLDIIVRCRLIIEKSLPFSYTLDGELYCSKDKHVSIELGEKIPFLVPNS
jgi:hypothetical protein